MKIAITGTSTGIGKHLAELLKFDHDVIELPRSVFDLDYPETYPTVVLNSKIDATGFYEFSIAPVYIDDYIPVRAKGELGIYLMDDMAKRSKELNN